jgi:PKD repeat protein
MIQLALALLLAAGTASTATGPSATTTFSTPGSKAVTLKVCNASGCSTTTKSIVVLDPVPKILSEFVPPTIGTSDPPVTFTVSASGRPPLVYNWTLTPPEGPPQTASGPSFGWRPSTVGAHQLALNVSNLYGVRSATVPFNVIPTVFGDVPPGFWASSFIEALYFAGVTGGCGTDVYGQRSFCPGNPVTRAEVAIFLGRALHPAPFTPPPAAGIFEDVSRTHWAAAWIEQIYRDGISAGCSVSGTRRFFCPGSAASRAEVAVLIERAVHPLSFVPPLPTGIFSDVPLYFWAASAIEQLYRDGITSGCSVLGPLRLFCPTIPLIRAEMAAFLVRGFHLEENPTPLTFLARLCTASSCSYPAGMPIDFNVQLRGGIPTSYDYDWNGDGVYEESVPFPRAHTYSTPGTFTPRLRLRRGAGSAVLVHPYPLRVLPAVYSTPPPPASLSASVDTLLAAGPTDPPGTPVRVAYRISIPPQAGLLGYALFVNSGAPGSSYQFAGLLEPNRATATDLLLLPPATAGAIRFLYVRAFSTTGYGPSSLPFRLP